MTRSRTLHRIGLLALLIPALGTTSAAVSAQVWAVARYGRPVETVGGPASDPGNLSAPPDSARPQGRAAAVQSAAAYDAFDGLTPSEIETFLRTARLVGVDPIGSGVTKPLRATLDDGRIRHAAEIQAVDVCEETEGQGGGGPAVACDSYKYNIAAYEIGKRLGLTAIPPSVERNFDGQPAAFTWWVENARTLADMEARGQWRPDMEEWQQQAATVTLFDELIFNTDRHQANLLMDPLGRVWMIDHSRAFGTQTRQFDPERLNGRGFDRSLVARLRDLNDAALQRCCAAYLSGEERTAVISRRDSILASLRDPGAPPAPAVP